MVFLVYYISVGDIVVYRVCCFMQYACGELWFYDDYNYYIYDY